MAGTWKVGADNLVWLRRLRHEQSGALVPNGTVTFTVYAPDGVTVVGGLQDAPMTYDPNFQLGPAYVGAVPAATPLVAGVTYKVRMFATAPDGSTRPFPLDCTASA